MRLAVLRISDSLGAIDKDGDTEIQTKELLINPLLVIPAHAGIQ